MMTKQEAIEILWQYDVDFEPHPAEEVMHAIDMAIEALQEQIERKMGEWISLDDFRGKRNEFGYKCSKCGAQNDYQDNFCPNCGDRKR